MGVLFGLLGGAFSEPRRGFSTPLTVNFFDRLRLEQLVDNAGFLVSNRLMYVKGSLIPEFAAMDTLALPEHVRASTSSPFRTRMFISSSGI